MREVMQDDLAAKNWNL